MCGCSHVEEGLLPPFRLCAGDWLTQQTEGQGHGVLGPDQCMQAAWHQRRAAHVATYSATARGT